MLSQMLERARAGESLWLPELREAFAAADDARVLVLRLYRLDGGVRDEKLFLPRWENPAERQLVLDYLKACVYNLLSVWSGEGVCFYCEPEDGELRALLAELETAMHAPGFEKPLRIAARLCRAPGRGPFRMETAPLAAWAPAPREEAPAGTDLAARLRGSCRRAEGMALCGIDVGGTDIKLAAALNGRLVCVKEYDWNPAESRTAEELLAPILRLARLMAACLAAERRDAPEALRARLRAALRRDAGDGEMENAVLAAEGAFASRLPLLDGVGVSFPDVVIGDRILGGETPKTKGMRENAALDYEAEFVRVGALKEQLETLCRPGGRVRITNDGNMAAYTAAVELAHGDAPDGIAGGVIAHSLGTDLGTGWLRADGRIPALPLELYDLLLDLGDFPGAAFPAADLRSTRNENSGLPGLRRYLGQAAAYRLAFEQNPALLEGFARQEGELLVIPTAPEDLRKPCLERLMELAAAGDGDAEEVFCRIGEHLALAVGEMDFLLSPGPRERFLFGRFVKSEACFRLLCEGFARRAPEHRLVAADENLACTPLMRQLARRQDVTVAQFGQAVGALYFALGAGD